MIGVPTNAGVGCPLAFVANIWLNILEPESNLRTIFCGLLIHVRHTIASVYLINLHFSFIFRTFLVIYSDRGLVRVILSYLILSYLIKLSPIIMQSPITINNLAVGEGRQVGRSQTFVSCQRRKDFYWSVPNPNNMILLLDLLVRAF